MKSLGRLVLHTALTESSIEDAVRRRQRRRSGSYFLRPTSDGALFIFSRSRTRVCVQLSADSGFISNRRSLAGRHHSRTACLRRSPSTLASPVSQMRGNVYTHREVFRVYWSGN